MDSIVPAISHRFAAIQIQDRTCKFVTKSALAWVFSSSMVASSDPVPISREIIGTMLLVVDSDFPRCVTLALRGTKDTIPDK